MTLVGYWPLNESSDVSEAKDHSRNENHGTIKDGGDSTVPGATGILGQNAYSFDGNNDYVSIDDTVVSSGRDSLTISAWIYIRGNPGNSWNRFVDVQDGANGSACALYWDDDDAKYGFSAMGESATVTGENPPSGKWMYWIGVLREGNIEFYMNGEKKAESSTSNTTSNSRVSIGKRYDKNDHALAKISEVRIYNHALTPSEVQYLYNVSQKGHQTTSKKTS